ncbi:uncharacterized protein LOC106768413 isoform X2 [Vigna radiata var. radiata]|uniref:Uncharacterized protein LOC106768413 isoform X2 n=1 Tax=Vigna radiata var. radiata TaxID=3916 RepID=A0A1S3USH8_VIGRR|nr:uncharacterized protein LOC106768413 isoform X2 [Vigna radiata var. radiata]
MAKRSPTRVNQTYETGCTWRMFRIFNFRESRSDRRLVSSRRHLNAHANENGKSRSNSGEASTVDEKCLQIGVSSRRRDYICRSINSMVNDEVADWENEVKKMIVDHRFVNTHYQGKDGAGCQPNQFLDALQILYTNKELFIKLLQDPNSLLVKQIQELQSSQVKEPCQHARQKMTSRLNKPQNTDATQCAKPFNSSDRSDLRSNRIVVLKPGTVNVENSVETSFVSPPHSPDSFSSNAQNTRLSHFPFSCIKRTLKHVMKVRRQEQQLKTADGIPSRLSSSSKGLGDGKKAQELEISERNSPIHALSNTGKWLNSYHDLKKKRENIIMFKDSALCMGQEAASFGESCSKNTSVSPREENILKMHVESRKSRSQMLNYGIEETFEEDINLKNSVLNHNLHAYYDIPRDGRYMDSPTQNINMNNIIGGSGSLLDLRPEIQTLSFSSDVSSSQSCQRTDNTVNMGNKVEHPNNESFDEHFIKDDVTNLIQPDESPEKRMHEKIEENHFEDLLRLSFDPMNDLVSSKDDIIDYVREILHALNLTLKRSSDQLLDPTTFVELKEKPSQLSGGTILHDCVIECFMQVYQNSGFPLHVGNVQAYVLKKLVVKEITELVNLHFHSHPSTLTLEQLVEMDLARRGSWLNIQVDAEDIAVELETHVLEKLVLEIASEMNYQKHDTLQ